MQSFSQQDVSENLHELMDIVQQGKEVLITIDGKPIARLVPVDSTEDGGADSEVPTEEVEQAFYGD